jgi:GDP/UDP-N,N'-diacetylbacillosamine 2-epimerase (hydrolysing)
MARHIVYISGTRADFGLMRRTLQALHAESGLTLSVLAAGMHLSPAHGDTIREIESSGLPIAARVAFPLEPATGATMARGIATMIAAFTDVLDTKRPDLLLLLGDRGEMLAGAIAALHLNIAVAHVHGGERSGTVDEPVRHAISKLAHLHLAATPQARDRLIAMGENPSHVHVTGAPGVDGLREGRRATRTELAARHALDPARPIALMVYHPVLQQADEAGEEAAIVIDTILTEGAQVLALLPNADAGSDNVRAQLKARAAQPGVALVTHLARDTFLDAMATADVMVGNSSAGIIEAGSFGTPVVNIGTRQNLRERNANVVDVAAVKEEIGAAIRWALASGRSALANIYGDGQAAARIVAVLRDTPLDKSLMSKINGY